MKRTRVPVGRSGGAKKPGVKPSKHDPADSPRPSPNETSAFAKLTELLQVLPSIVGPVLIEVKQDKEARKLSDLRERCTLAALTGLCANKHAYEFDVLCKSAVVIGNTMAKMLTK